MVKLDEYLRACSRYSSHTFVYPITSVTMEPGVIYEDEEFTVNCGRLGASDYGRTEWRKDRAGAF